MDLDPEASRAIIGNVRLEDGKVISSFMTGEEQPTWFTFTPEFAADFGYALLYAAEPSLWARFWGVWRSRRGNA